MCIYLETKYLLYLVGKKVAENNLTPEAIEALKQLFDSTKLLTEEQIELNKRQAEYAVRMEKLKTALDGAASGAIGFGKGVGQALTTQSEGFTKYTGAFDSFGKGLTGVVELIPGFGKGLALATTAVMAFGNSMMKQADTFVKTYNDLAKAGVGAGETYKQLTSMANAAGYTADNVDKFAGAIKSLGPNMIALGGTAKGAVEQFGKLSNLQDKVVKDQMDKYFRLGFSQEEYTQAQADTINAMINSGQSLENAQKRQGGLAAATGEYLDNLIKLSAITGKNVEDLKKQRDQVVATTQLQAYLAQEDAKAAKLRADGHDTEANALEKRTEETKNMLQQAQDIMSPEQFASFQKMVASGTLMDKGGGALMVLDSRILQTIQDVKSGKATGTDLIKELADASKQQSMGGLGSALINDPAGRNAGDLGQSVEMMKNATRYAGKTTAEIEKMKKDAAAAATPQADTTIQDALLKRNAERYMAVTMSEFQNFFPPYRAAIIGNTLAIAGLTGVIFYASRKGLFTKGLDFIKTMGGKGGAATAAEGAAGTATAAEGAAGTATAAEGAVATEAVAAGGAGIMAAAVPAAAVIAAGAVGYGIGTIINKIFGEHINAGISKITGQDAEVKKAMEANSGPEAMKRSLEKLNAKIKDTGYTAIGAGKYKGQDGKIIGKDDLPPDVAAKLGITTATSGSLGGERSKGPANQMEDFADRLNDAVVGLDRLIDSFASFNNMLVDAEKQANSEEPTAANLPGGGIAGASGYRMPSPSPGGASASAGSVTSPAAPGGASASAGSVTSPAAPLGTDAAGGTGSTTGVKSDVLNKKAQLEKTLGKKLVITSGVRSGVNHSTGDAIDIGLASNRLSESERNAIFSTAIGLGFTGLGAEYRAPGGPHIHLDTSHRALTGWGSDYTFRTLGQDSPYLANLLSSRRGGVRQMALGGITDGISIAGEAGREAVVPLPNGRSIPVELVSNKHPQDIAKEAVARATMGSGDMGKVLQDISNMNKELVGVMKEGFRNMVDNLEKSNRLQDRLVKYSM